MFSCNSTRISNELGAGCPNVAYLAVIVTLFMAFICGVLEFAFIMSLWKVWGKAFSHVHEVVTYVNSMTPVVAISAFVDSFQTPLQGNDILKTSIPHKIKFNFSSINDIYTIDNAI